MKKLFIKKNDKGVFVPTEDSTATIEEIIKSKIPEPFEHDVAYIICPDLKCNGFYEPYMQCLRMSNDYEPMCPKKDEAYRIHLDYYNHHLKVPVNESQWKRLECPDCGGCVFQNGTNYWRIEKSEYEEWRKENGDNIM